MVEAEEKVLGFTHADIGGCLTEMWMFPQHIQDSIRYHHDSTGAGDRLFSAILEFSDMITKSRLYAVYGDQYVDFVIEDHPSWDIIKEEMGDQDIDFVRLLFEMDDEIERARELVKQARET